MRLRQATLADVPRLVAMGCRFIAETQYRGFIEANPGRLEALARRLIEQDDALLLVTVDAEDAAVGMLGLLLFVHPMSGDVTASEMFWWVEPAHRGDGLRLLHAGQRWATGRGAAVLLMIAPAGSSVGMLYERLHYAAVETTYQVRLTP